MGARVKITAREKGETWRWERKMTSPHLRVSPFLHGVIFMHGRVSLALLSLRKKGDYSKSIIVNLFKNLINPPYIFSHKRAFHSQRSKDGSHFERDLCLKTHFLSSSFFVLWLSGHVLLRKTAFNLLCT